MSKKTFAGPIALHFSFATQRSPPDLMEQQKVRNHIFIDLKQFSYSISCWAGVASVLSCDEEQRIPQPIDDDLADDTAIQECPAREHKNPDTPNFVPKPFPPGGMIYAQANCVSM